jgi:hypothetical protein
MALAALLDRGWPPCAAQSVGRELAGVSPAAGVVELHIFTWSSQRHPCFAIAITRSELSRGRRAFCSRLRPEEGAMANRDRLHDDEQIPKTPDDVIGKADEVDDDEFDEPDDAGDEDDEDVEDVDEAE